MSGDRGIRRPADAGHLDSDPEAMEDPVHRGDAEHQHESHQHARHDADAAKVAEATDDTDGDPADAGS